ncbi:rod shape-determining protein [Candidatus Shapirobacteria bacterium CG_4_9_14_0_2_um_filter_39_11]|uniref:Cell shape-determining protein MreB n=1 Tax=Candidatus Shapirobacteria bacterium CG_4_9_14_0_2_um_filter_39_11 TaxID=1974478 RepID=A0A2M8ES54_9BACT|nr:MAG: rod shape-determining protein [Candidatus Shapirobacteria bacterium CG_4_9_14_0_2_um_filter_39_11]
MLDLIFSFFSHDIGIDLGTANTLVLVLGKGIVIREPSVIARQKKTKEILAIGSKAKKMIGKTPGMIEVIRPLKDGVIADFDATEAMLTHYIREVHESPGIIPKIPKPRVVVGIPLGVTEVERRAVQDACLSAGARKAYLIEEPMAAVIGVGLPIDQPEGMLVVDIGGGTTEIAVISLGGIVIERCLRIAGDEMDEAIISFMRLKYSILLGEATAEEIKIQLGSTYPQEKEKQMVVRGRDLESGLPKSIKIGTNEVREAIAPIVRQIVEAISEVIEETPPELISDIVARGITLCGGAAQLIGFDKLIAEETKMPVWLADDPMTCVVRGCGRVLGDEGLLKRVRVTGGLR